MQLDKNRISPGSKNWIPFFFHLHQQGELKIGYKLKSHSLEDCLHYIFNQTGLLYGLPVSNLYCPEKYVAHLTSDEKLKLLLLKIFFSLTTIFNLTRKYLTTHSLIPFYLFMKIMPIKSVYGI